MGLCIVLEGSPIRGWDCHGPFNNEKEGYDWAYHNEEFGDEWWVMVLIEPRQPAAEPAWGDLKGG